MLRGYQTAGEITKQGALKLLNRSGFSRAMRRMKPGPVIVVVEYPTRHRSGQANRYYWGVVLAMIAEYTGHDQMELHEYFKKRFNPIAFTLGKDEQIIGGSTTQMDTQQFTEYVEAVRRFAATELSVNIPDPNEVAA
jgi:hypothetical protein